MHTWNVGNEKQFSVEEVCNCWNGAVCTLNLLYLVLYLDLNSKNITAGVHLSVCFSFFFQMKFLIPLMFWFLPIPTLFQKSIIKIENLSSGSATCSLLLTWFSIHNIDFIISQCIVFLLWSTYAFYVQEVSYRNIRYMRLVD